MQFDTNYILAIPLLLIMMSVLVAAHEYGHYLFARMFGMGVEEFSIGFGKKRLFTWMRKSYEVEGVPGSPTQTTQAPQTDGSLALAPEPDPAPSNVKLTVHETTDFTVRPIPLGGFVKIKGMLPEDDGSETRVPGGFYSKAPWKRFLVLFAGPLFSVVAGILVLIPVFTIWGIDKPVLAPVIGAVGANEPAGKAGFKPGDRVLTIDGEPIESFYEMTQIVQKSAGKQLTITFERDGKQFETKATPELREGPVMTAALEQTGDTRQQGMLGMGPDVVKEPQPLGEAVRAALYEPIRVVKGMVGIIAKPSRFENSVGGPATMAKLTNEFSKQGIEYVLWLSAMLSISVGIFNLLPIYPLDGGQMMVALIEMLRGGRRLSMRTQNAVAGVGLALVAMLFISVLFVDAKRFLVKPKEEGPAVSKQQTDNQK